MSTTENNKESHEETVDPREQRKIEKAQKENLAFAAARREMWMNRRKGQVTPQMVS